MSLTFKTKIGKKRTLVIPKKVAEETGIDEGVIVVVKVDGNRIIIEPFKDAVWLSLYGEKIAKISLRELEEESLERQEKYIYG